MHVVRYNKRSLPVQEMESTPGPKYSTMAPVPPFTVKMSATFKITSFGAVQPPSFPVKCTPITYGKCDVNSASYSTKHNFEDTGNLSIFM